VAKHARISARSAPAQNAFVPAPVSTTSALAGGLVVALLMLWMRTAQTPPTAGPGADGLTTPEAMVEEVSPRIVTATLAQLRRQLDEGRLSAAQTLLATLPALARSKADAVALATRLEERMVMAERAMQRAEDSAVAGDTRLTTAFRAEARALWRDRAEWKERDGGR